MLGCYSPLILDHQVNFVLQNDNVLELHNVHGNKMLTSLWLGVGLITRNEEESCVHDGRTRQHCRHEGIVTWAIHERDVPREDQWRVALFAVYRIRLL